jgi:hypothetical protein
MQSFEGMAWHKSRQSGYGNCVEVTVAPFNGKMGMRDTKNPDGAVLAFPTSAWTSFLTEIKTGGMR